MEETKRAKLDHVPVFLSEAEFLISSKHKARYENLINQFSGRFGCQPTLVCRAPGRVNLIGEHIDYSGYGVLPMAIEQDVMIAATTNQSNELHVANILDAYTQRTVKAWPIDIDDTKHDWINYLLAGFKGLLEDMSSTDAVGMNILVDGVIPPGAGLSSSSAFVVCAALTASKGNNIDIGKTALAAICAKAEQFVGTEGGGMDQAISVMAEENVALHVQFNPLTTTPVVLPKDGLFVVTNSLVEAHKQATAHTHYNKRVVECRAAALILARKLGLSNWRTCRRLIDVHKASGHQLCEMPQIVSQHLKRGHYSKEDISAELQLDTQELMEHVLSSSTKDQTEFCLHDRAFHVFSEAQRVIDFVETSSLTEMGNLMNDSHTSCDELYDCSCNELNRLVTVCRNAGALGARLTGAGWGGCVVSLVPRDCIDTFITDIKAQYYQSDPRLEKQMENAMFVTAAGPGARVLVLPLCK